MVVVIVRMRKREGEGMKYYIEFELPDNDVVLEGIEHEWVRWGVWGYSGYAYAKPVAYEKPDLSTMLFSERKELAEKYEQWAKKNCVKDCALSVIAYLCAFGYIPTLFNQSRTETLPSAQPEVRTQMSSADRISRQAAIDAVCSVCGDTECNIFDPDNKAKLYCPEPYALSKLPSAEPETHDNARETHECDNERTETHDLISRKAAIDFIDAGHLCNPNELRWSDNDVVNFLKKRPSAEPERKIYAEMPDEEFEKWLYEHGICHPDINETISCKAVQLLIDDAINELPLCLNCGARMDGESE